MSKNDEFQVLLPKFTLQSVQLNSSNPISLQALGLLSNLVSYPSHWKINKTEVQNRFAKNKATSVKKAWKELVKSKYIIEGKYRNGSKWIYVYLVNKKPFTDEEIAEKVKNIKLEHGDFLSLGFEQFKMNNTKTTTNQINKYNKNNISNINKVLNEEDLLSDRTKYNVPCDTKSIIKELTEKYSNSIQEFELKAIMKKVKSKYDNGEIMNFKNYLESALIKKEKEINKRSGILKEVVGNRNMQQIDSTSGTPLYNWLEKKN